MSDDAPLMLETLLYADARAAGQGELAFRDDHGAAADAIRARAFELRAMGGVRGSIGAGPRHILHWTMAVLILAMLFIGIGMVAMVSSRYLALLSLHKAIGIGILVLALIRVCNRLLSRPPTLTQSMPRLQACCGNGVARGAVWLDARHAIDWMGHALGGRLSGGAGRRVATTAHPAA